MFSVLIFIKRLIQVGIIYAIPIDSNEVRLATIQDPVIFDNLLGMEPHFRQTAYCASLSYR